MESKEAVAVLASLAQETRLAVFRHLVTAGEEGTSAGAIAAELDVPVTDAVVPSEGTRTRVDHQFAARRPAHLLQRELRRHEGADRFPDGGLLSRTSRGLFLVETPPRDDGTFALIVAIVSRRGCATGRGEYGCVVAAGHAEEPSLALVTRRPWRVTVRRNKHPFPLGRVSTLRRCNACTGCSAA